MQVRSHLDRQVEIQRDYPKGEDSTDPDVLSYVREFMEEYSRIQPLPTTSLLTKADAQHALTVLTKAQSEIDAHLKTARALKKMLQDKQEPHSGGDS